MPGGAERDDDEAQRHERRPRLVPERDERVGPTTASTAPTTAAAPRRTASTIAAGASSSRTTASRVERPRPAGATRARPTRADDRHDRQERGRDEPPSAAARAPHGGPVHGAGRRGHPSTVTRRAAAARRPGGATRPPPGRTTRGDEPRAPAHPPTEQEPEPELQHGDRVRARDREGAAAVRSRGRRRGSGAGGGGSRVTVTVTVVVAHRSGSTAAQIVYSNVSVPTKPALRHVRGRPAGDRGRHRARAPEVTVAGPDQPSVVARDVDLDRRARTRRRRCRAPRPAAPPRTPAPSRTAPGCRRRRRSRRSCPDRRTGHVAGTSSTPTARPPRSPLRGGRPRHRRERVRGIRVRRRPARR